MNMHSPVAFLRAEFSFKIVVNLLRFMIILSSPDFTHGFSKKTSRCFLRSGAISRDELAEVLLALDGTWTDESIDQLLCEADSSIAGAGCHTGDPGLPKKYIKEQLNMDDICRMI